MHAGLTEPAPRPVTFGPCFGWLHAPAGPKLHRAVLLCPPFGAEALHTYRSLRHLAVLLARCGLTVLRFDYPGTGDSLETGTAEKLETWISSIADAAAFLTAHSGGAPIALCGVRLGGLLAAEAARRQPGAFCRIALLAPVISGSGHARELMLSERMMRDHAPIPGRVEVAGFTLEAPDLRLLDTLDLAEALAASRVAAVLMLHGPNDRPEQSWAAPLEKQGCVLSVEKFAGYVEFAREAHLNSVPDADFARATQFLAEGATEAAPGSSAEPAWQAILTDGDVVDQPISFGADRGLFGIISMPKAGAGNTALAVLILNSGSTHHVGDARYAVLLARALAEEGVASLRVDVSGIGDSPREPQKDLTGGGADAYRRARARLYGTDFSADIEAALDVLEARGFGRVVVMGVCSGATHALSTALRDPRVTGLILANPPGFVMQAAPVAEKPNAGLVVPLSNRLARRLLGRLARYHLLEAWRGTRRAVAPLHGAALVPLMLRLGIGKAARLDRVLRLLSARGVRSLFLYSEGDPGFAALESCFGPGARRLTAISGMETAMIEGRNHAFSVCSMRDELVARSRRHVRAIRDGSVPALEAARQARPLTRLMLRRRPHSL